MDIIAQILLNSTILLFGFFLLFPFISKMNPLLHFSLAWFTGWGIVGFVEILMVITGISVEISQIALISLGILVFVNVYCKYQGVNYSRDLRKYFVLFSLFFWSVFVICLLASYANYMHYSADSITNEGLSRVFHIYGLFAEGNSKVYYWLFNKRLPFYIAIHNIAYLSGIKIFYSFLSVTTIMIALMITGFWLEGKKKFGYYTLLWFIVCLCFCFTNKIIIFHSFYSLSNLTNMAYYSGGILCLNLFRKKQDSFWFFIGCFFLGITCIIRKEMLILSLLPFLFVFKDLKPDKKIIITCFSVYIITAYSWFFWGLLFLKDWNEIFGNALKTSNHGSATIAVFCFAVSIVTFFLIPKINNSKKITLYYFVPVAAISVFIIFYFFGNAFAESTCNLLSLMFSNKGEWGWFWYVFALFTLSFAIVGLFFKISAKYHNFSFDWFLPGIIINFFILRILLYTVFSAPADGGWNDSGNRVLMHIMPVCAFWMSQVVENKMDSRS